MKWAIIWLTSIGCYATGIANMLINPTLTNAVLVSVLTIPLLVLIFTKTTMAWALGDFIMYLEEFFSAIKRRLSQ